MGGDYGEHIEEPYDHSIEQEIYDEPYMEDSKAKDTETCLETVGSR